MLKVCIDARAAVPSSGGVRQTVIGLISGLSRLAGPEEYLALVRPEEESWMASQLGGLGRPIVGEGRRGLMGPFARRVSALAPLALRRVLRAAAQRLTPIPVPSDGTVERSGAQVIHFASQDAFRTEVPSIYVPQDLQHLHLPELFAADILRWRLAAYPAFCAQARAVVALTRWGKADLVRQLGIDPGKIHVIGYASLLGQYGEPDAAALARARARFALPAEFALYPAQTWKHKNHMGLVEALALLQGQGVRIPVVCTGFQDEHLAAIEKRAHSLGVADQVRFLGFVAEADVAALYRLARLLVFPSRFEGFGMPVVEAFEAGLPVACARASALPEVAGDAALLFDPESPKEMAAALQRVWEDEALRRDLVARGRARVAGRSWEGVARSYRALYRLVGGATLSDEDRALLGASQQPSPG